MVPFMENFVITFNYQVTRGLTDDTVKIFQFLGKFEKSMEFSGPINNTAHKHRPSIVITDHPPNLWHFRQYSINQSYDSENRVKMNNLLVENEGN